MERDQTHKISQFAVRSAFALSIILGLSIGVELRRSGCIDRVEWDGKDHKIAVCKTQDNHIMIMTPNYPPRQLPDGVCRPSQVWISGGDRIIWFQFVDEGYEFIVNDLDLKTGVIGEPSTYFIPAPYVNHIKNNC